MRISEIFNLNKSQAELDFIDIDPEKDIPLFLDPHFLANRDEHWSIEATRTIRNFFQHLITLLKNNQLKKARTLFSYLSEPNETCLGLSKESPQGHGVGPIDTDKIFDSLSGSKAIQSGLVEDLEDCVIFVDNFNKDKLSDMTTNIIRMHLIQYTQSQCNLWGIKLTPNIQSGNYWDRTANEWKNNHTDMLVVNSKKLLLVPKGAVSYMKDYTPQKFHRHHALVYLQNEHLRLDTALVKRRKRRGGIIERYVTKTDLIEEVSPGTKDDLNLFVEKHPEVFHEFKKKMQQPSRSLLDEEIEEINIADIANHLILSLKKTPPGKENANTYHNIIIGALELLFYPELTCPQKEKSIHEGRKRIDITFDNAASYGIFYELSKDISCQYISVECKNYDGDPKNPELDQLAGRFSPNRGKVGLLVCRKIDDMDTFIKRCNDTYKEDRGLIIPVTDNDLIKALEFKINRENQSLSEILRDRRRTIQIN